MRRPHFGHSLFAIFLLAAAPALAKGPVSIDPEKTDADFPLQGEYTGEVKIDAAQVKYGAQIIALGGGRFRAVGYVGGLPGDGWNQQSEKVEVEGELKDGVVTFKGNEAEATIKDGAITVVSGGEKLGELKRVVRKSPTQGARPPEAALVLFDGKDADQWENGRVQDGLLMEGVTSKRKFGSHKIHIEFLLPYMPEDREQGRGNSGIYVQGRYEVQMLDSFGLAGKNNECGGIYSVRDPDLNMCFPPLSWQTYDIEYTAAKFDDAGKLVANPRMTVLHNGVAVHKDAELPGERSTTAAPSKPGPQPGPIHLQNHGCPIRYRNIWVVETK